MLLARYTKLNRPFRVLWWRFGLQSQDKNDAVDVKVDEGFSACFAVFADLRHDFAWLRHVFSKILLFLGANLRKGIF